MNRISRRLLLLVLLVACFYSTIAASRMERPTLSTPDCLQDCATKRDKSLENCARLSAANKTRCENLANDNYTKCAASCDGNAAKP